MNKDQLEGNWEILKGKIQQTWGRLTDDDIDVIEGKRKQLAGRLQERYGYVTDKAEEEIDRFLRDCACSDKPKKENKDSSCRH